MPTSSDVPPIDADGIYRPFLPRLFIKENNVSLEGDPGFPAPLLFYCGTGSTA